MRSRHACAACLLGTLSFAALPARGEDDPISGPAFAEATLEQTLQGLSNKAARRRIDREALEHTRRSAEGEHAASPGPGPDGSVSFVYASTRVRVFCQVLQLCDIELQQGEQVHKVMVSDKTQWLQDRSEANGAVHIVVQPTLPNVTCSMGIYTDRRVYYLELVATAENAEHMPRVRFVYPEDQKEEWSRLMRAEERQPSSGEPEREVVEVRPEHLYFGYEIAKEGRWRARQRIDWAPLRAYDDGERTYIEMPHLMLSSEAPILLVRNGDHKAAIVNYALKGTHFVVGRLFQEAILVRGNGRRQERVRISRVEDD